MAVGELQLPVLAGVAGVVDAGLVAGSGGHEERLIGIEGDHGAEVERGCVGDLSGVPREAAVDGAEIGAVRSAGPRDLTRDGTDSAQTFGGVRELDAGTLG